MLKKFILTPGNAKYEHVREGIVNFTLPAFRTDRAVGYMKKGDLVCKGAFLCARGCYALAGRQGLPGSRAPQHERLAFSMTDAFVGEIVEEIGWYAENGVETRVDLGGGKSKAGPKRTLKLIRIHDSGDFYDEPYLLKWFEVCRKIGEAYPNLKFWAYTKQVKMLKANWGAKPENLVVVFSEGGWEDSLIDVYRDKFCRVFVGERQMREAIKAGWFEDGMGEKRGDIDAVFGPKNVGLFFHSAWNRSGEYKAGGNYNPFTTDPNDPVYPAVREVESRYMTAIMTTDRLRLKSEEVDRITEALGELKKA